jgi:hypothetical protein
VLGLALLAHELGEDIAELDINPLIVGPRGEGAVAVDAVVVPRAGSLPAADLPVASDH